MWAPWVYDLISKQANLNPRKSKQQKKRDYWVQNIWESTEVWVSESINQTEDEWISQEHDFEQQWFKK